MPQRDSSGRFVKGGGGGASLGAAHGKIVIDASGVSAGVNQALGALGRLGSVGAAAGAALGTAVATGVAAAGAALGVLGIKAIQAGSDVEEMMSKYSVVFGAYADGVAKDLQGLATEVGRNRYELMGFAATFQDTFVPLGFARGEAATLSTQLTQLTVDLGSFNNVAEPQVLMDLQSAIVGNHETMRKYGVVITETTLGQELLRMGIAGGTAAATEQEKVMARLNLIYAGTKDAQGDAARTADGFANQMRGLKASVQETVQGIGLGLLPLATQFVSAFRAIEPALSTVLSGVFSILKNMVEVGVAFVQSLAESLGVDFDNLASNAETWGANIVTMLAQGMANAAAEVIAVLTELGMLIAYWLAPGSPPKLLPDLPAWGASAMTEFMNGWASGDFSVFDTISGTVEGLVRQIGANLPEVDLMNAVIGSREAVAQAIEQMRTVGSVSKATMDAIVAGAGPAAGAVQSYITAMLQSEGAMNALNRAQDQLRAVQDITLENYRQFAGALSGRVSPAVQNHLNALRQLEQANTAYEQAQARLNAVTTKYDNLLGPLNAQLQALRNTQTAAAEDDQLARLNEDINTGWLTGAELREAIAQRDAILLQRRIREVEAQRDAEVGAARDAMETAEEAQQSAEERAEATRQAAIEAAEAEVAAAQRKVDALDEQIARNQAIIEQIQEEIRLQEELAKAIEEAAKKTEEATEGGGSGGSGGSGGGKGGAGKAGGVPKVGGAGGMPKPGSGSIFDRLKEALGGGDTKGIFDQITGVTGRIAEMYKELEQKSENMGRVWAKAWGAFTKFVANPIKEFLDSENGQLLIDILKNIALIVGGAVLVNGFIKLGGAVLGLFTPVTLLVVAIGALIALLNDPRIQSGLASWKENADQLDDIYGTLATQFLEHTGLISTGLGEWLLSIDGWFAQLVALFFIGWAEVLIIFETVWNKISTAAGIWLTTLVNNFIAKFMELKESLGFDAVWASIVERAESHWQRLTAGWDALWTGFSLTLTAIGEAVKIGWDALWTGLSLTGQTIWQSLTSGWDALWTGFSLTLTAIGTAVKVGWDALWTGVSLTGQTIWQSLTSGWNALWTGFSLTLTAIGTAVKVGWDALWTGVSLTGQAIWQSLTSGWNAFWSGLSLTLSAIGTAIKTGWDALWTGLSLTVQAIWTEIKTAVETKLAELKAAIEEKINGVKTWISDQKSAFFGVGSDLINGLKEGAAAMAGELIEAVTGVVEDAIAAAKALLGIASPSKVFMAMGQFMGEGLAIGLTNSTRLAVRSASDMANRVVGAMKPIKNAMKFDEIAAATTKMKAAASDIFAADTNRKKFFDMVNWNAVGAVNNLIIGNSMKPQMSASSRPPVNDFWAGIDPATLGKKETNLSIAQVVLPNVSDGNDLLRQLTDYGSAYGGGNY